MNFILYLMSVESDLYGWPLKISLITSPFGRLMTPPLITVSFRQFVLKKMSNHVQMSYKQLRYGYIRHVGDLGE